MTEKLGRDYHFFIYTSQEISSHRISSTDTVVLGLAWPESTSGSTIMCSVKDKERLSFRTLYWF